MKLIQQEGRWKRVSTFDTSVIVGHDAPLLNNNAQSVIVTDDAPMDTAMLNNAPKFNDAQKDMISGSDIMMSNPVDRNLFRDLLMSPPSFSSLN